MTSLWFDISRCADDEWVRAKDSAAAATAAKAWRRMAGRVMERPADIYRSVFTLLDTTQAGALPLANAVRFLAFVLPFTMPSERLELMKLAMAEHVQQAGTSATAGVHSCGTAHAHSYGTADGSAIVAVGNAHAPAARASSRPMLSRGEFVDLCLRLLWSIPLSQLEACIRQWTEAEEAAALPARWLARSQSTLEAARHAAAYRQAKADALLTSERRIRARRAAEQAARDQRLYEQFLAERNANEQAAARVAAARRDAEHAEVERSARQRAEQRERAANPLPRWYTASGNYL